MMGKGEAPGGWLMKNTGGEPVYLMGTTYMPRYCGDDPWEEWKPQDVRAELTRLKGLGMNCFRIFLYWHQLQPVPGKIDDAALRKIDEHVTIAHDLGVYLMPTIAGHMGVHWYPQWAKGRHFYLDPEVVEGWRLMWQTLGGRYRDERAIIAWDVANELEWFAAPDSRAQLRGWLSKMFDAVRQADPSHPIGYGPGGGEIAYSAKVLFEDAVELGDYVGVHDYPYPHIMYFKGPQNIRLSYDTPFHLALASLGKPNMLQEYGINTLVNSEEAAAACYRTTMCSCLAQGSCGFLNWSWIDYDPDRMRAPGGAPGYCPEVRPELNGAIIGQPFMGYLNVNVMLGIARGDGQWKAMAFTMEKFAKALAEMRIEQFRPPERKAAILIQTNAQDHRRGGLAIDLRRYLPAYLESFILNLQAKTNASFRRVDASFDDLRLMYLPGVIDLPVEDAERLHTWVKNGGILYCSWAGFANDLRKLFGIQPESPVPCRAVERIQFTTELPGIHKGQKLEFHMSRPDAGAMRLAFLPGDAEVLAVDTDKHPVFVRKTFGKGSVYFMGFSPELYRSSSPEHVPGGNAWTLYRALAVVAGMIPPFDCQDPEIELGWLDGPSAVALIVVNHENRPKTCSVTSTQPVEGAAELFGRLPLRVEGNRIRLTLEPFGAAIIRLER
jgi:endo-1,4-beta-mannosidase